MKDVQARGEVPEENLDDVVGKPLLGVAPKLTGNTPRSKGCVRNVKGNMRRKKDLARRVERRFAIASDWGSYYILIMSNKGRAKGRAEAGDDDAESVDSMAMDIDEPGSDFGSDIGPPPAKKAGTSRGKRAATSVVAGKKASSSGRKHLVS
jgi:hypothetical protein